MLVRHCRTRLRIPLRWGRGVLVVGHYQCSIPTPSSSLSSLFYLLHLALGGIAKVPSEFHPKVVSYFTFPSVPCPSLSPHGRRVAGARIQGSVFDDMNANGLLDAGEAGVANTSVMVVCNRSDVPAVIVLDTTVTTAADGTYAVAIPLVSTGPCKCTVTSRACLPVSRLPIWPQPRK